MKTPLLSLLCVALLFAVTSCKKEEPPQTLDLSAYFTDKFDGKPSTGDIVGDKVFDGLPFDIKGRVALYGKITAENAGKSREDFPDAIGVKVGRAFDELHLLHTTRWPDLEGVTIARIRLNYADGKSHDLEIGYGVHVRDWQRLQSEEQETVTSPDTKVVWRGSGIEHFKSSQRMFKSMLMNPFPEKRVETIDFLSAGQMATYQLYAATVANSDSNRTETPPVPQDRQEWKFDGELSIRVVDQNGNRVNEALIDTSLEVPGTGWATSGQPVYTNARGIAVVKYPKARTDLLILAVSKDGWQSASKRVNLKTDESLEKGVEIIMERTSSQ